VLIITWFCWSFGWVRWNFGNLPYWVR